MAHTAISDPEMMKERFDAEDVLEAKIDQLAQWMREADGNAVVFTGAGISTSCGIGDFRGPDGAWTRKARGLAPKRGTPTVKAVPSLTHMGIVELLESAMIKRLISQNCDGLHVRSGVAHTAISELHGNSNVEYCIECGQKYLRDWACRRITRSRDHYTGRHCVALVDGGECGGRLWDSTIDFGQNLPEEPLQKAYEASETAALHVVFGSSLTVSPACDMPALTKERGGRLVIVNLQKTPLTCAADVHIFAKTDVVMAGLLARLGMEAREWRLARRLTLTHGPRPSATPGYAVALAGVDVANDNLPASTVRAARISLFPAPGATPLVAMAREEPFAFDLDTPPIDASAASGLVSVVWMGHYNEPRLDIPFALAPTTTTATIDLAFDPRTGEWHVVARSDAHLLATRAAATVLDSASASASTLASASGLPAQRELAIAVQTDTSGAYLATETRLASLPDDAVPAPLLWACAETVVPEGSGEDGAGAPAVVVLGGLPPRESAARGESRAAVYSLLASGRSDGGGAVAAWFLPQAGNLDVVARGYGSSPRAVARATGFLQRWLAASAVASRSSVLLFGGCDSAAMYNDLNTVTVSISTAHDRPTMRLVCSPVALAPASHAAPAHRLGASLTAVGPRTFVLFGGSVCVNGPYEYLSDVHRLELDADGCAAWTPLATTGTPPARAQHAALFLPHLNSVLVVGGVSNDALYADAHLLDLDTLAWTCLAPGTQPAAPDSSLPATVALGADESKAFRIKPVRPLAIAVDTHTVLVWGLARQPRPAYALGLDGGWSDPAGPDAPLAAAAATLPLSAAAAATISYVPRAGPRGTDVPPSYSVTAVFGGVTGRGERVGGGPTLVRV